MNPTPGRIVLYRNDIGMDVPAIVSMTPESWRDECVIGQPDPSTVHLVAFGPSGGEDSFFDYQPGWTALNVPEDATKDAHVPSHSWRWPPRD